MVYTVIMLKKPLLLVVLTLALFPLLASAAVHVGGDYFLKASERVPDDLYVVAPSAALSGDSAADALIAASSISSQAHIGADAFFAGERIELAGEVGDDARLLGADIDIRGRVGDDVLAFGSRIALSKDAAVGGNLYLAGGSVASRGAVSGSIRIIGRDITLAGSVAGDAEVWGRLTLEEGAVIGGDLLYHARRESAIPESVRIGGKVLFDKTDESSFPFVSGLFSGFFALRLIMSLVLAFFLLFLTRERTEEVLLDAVSRFWPRALRGLLIALIVPLAAVLLFASVVGLPLGLLLLFLFISGCILGEAFAGILVGAFVERLWFKRSPFPLFWRPVLIGTVLLSLVSLVPFAGPLANILLALAGVGSLGTVFYRYIRLAS